MGGRRGGATNYQKSNLMAKVAESCSPPPATHTHTPPRPNSCKSAGSQTLCMLSATLIAAFIIIIVSLSLPEKTLLSWEQPRKWWCFGESSDHWKGKDDMIAETPLVLIRSAPCGARGWNRSTLSQTCPCLLSYILNIAMFLTLR